MVDATPWLLYAGGREPVPIVGGGPQGRSGQVRKTVPPTGIRSPDRPAHSESLYPLSYPGSPYEGAYLIYLTRDPLDMKALLAVETLVCVKLHGTQRSIAEDTTLSHACVSMQSAV